MGSHGSRASIPSRWTDRFEQHWLGLLFAGSAVLVTVATIVKFVHEPFRIHDDSALFQHAGWYILQGATPYVDFWDLKPPLIYAVTTVLAFLSGGNMMVLHLLSIGVAVASVVGGVTLVGLLTYRLTAHEFASFVAGATMFVVPSLYGFPAAGLRPKYLALLFGGAGLLLAVTDRPALSGAAAATSAGFWQLGGPIAALVLAIGFQRGRSRGLARTIAGGAFVTAVVVAPFVAADATIPLFLETVLAPIYGVERYTVSGRLLDLVLTLGYGVLVIPLGVYGWVRGIALDWRRYWWVGAGGSLYSLQIFLEMQGAIELVLPLLFLSIGVGLVIATARTPRRRSIVAGTVALLAVASLYWVGGPVTPIKTEVEETHEAVSVSNYETLPEKPDEIESMQTIYWEKRQPESCHYRLGQKQREYAQRTGGSLTQAECGRWPFGDPPREWLTDRIR
ncbi:DolP-mannose mannosyltransferase [Natrialba sp. PRR66]|uniref:DolP-mannose mannosyltransferase n=1 Tax=Natrialba sp. PRR66 TaxID=3098146 RepID=UPI002B1D0183|nr:DolP-mannose mannosyltransferase [Natrialba sp. PRR66]